MHFLEEVIAMASAFPRFPEHHGSPIPTFNREQIAFLEALLVNRACGFALINSLTHGDGKDCLACAARVESLVQAIRGMKNP